MAAQGETPIAADQMDVARLYAATAHEMSAGWELQGLQCTSTGLQPHLRGSEWLAEACGPAGECVKVKAEDPAEALQGLADELRLRREEPH